VSGILEMLPVTNSHHILLLLGSVDQEQSLRSVIVWKMTLYSQRGPLMNYKMHYKDYYGCVIIPLKVFEKLNPSYFISRSSNDVKYMCANLREKEHLKEIGVDVLEYVDYYEIFLDTSTK
jgi:hypothetical protein